MQKGGREVGGSSGYVGREVGEGSKFLVGEINLEYWGAEI